MYFMVYLSISTAHLPFRKKRSQDLDVDMTQIQRKNMKQRPLRTEFQINTGVQRNGVLTLLSSSKEHYLCGFRPGKTKGIITIIMTNTMWLINELSKI